MNDRIKERLSIAALVLSICISIAVLLLSIDYVCRAHAQQEIDAAKAGIVLVGKHWEAVK